MLVALSFFFYCSNGIADISENLINPQAWQGATYGNDPGGCCTSISGSGALFDNSTNTILFSYGSDLLAQTIAINQALGLSGIQLDGLQYGWTWRRIGNNGRDGDTLRFQVQVTDSAGNVVEQYNYDRSDGSGYGTTDQWTTEQFVEMFGTSYPDPSTAAISIRGQDGGFWGGYYGPEVKDVSLRFIYRADPCAGNPLYDPSCNGYAEAYAQQQYDQNCSANALYDPGCPGYYQAYEAQQCSINPLFTPSCPGYAQAYYDQQCSANALYDVQCPGYAQAYFDQQCNINPLYSEQCTGYAAAYLSQQCSIDDLYDRSCPGYNEAYALKNIVNTETTSVAIDLPSATIVSTSDPVAELTTVSATGDSTVDQVLSDQQPVEVISYATEQLSDTSGDMEQSVGAEGDTNSDGPEGDSNRDTESDTGGNSESGEQTQPSDSRREKVKQLMKERAKELANEMGEAATLEAQQAIQAAVVASMGAAPGFDAYSISINGGTYGDATGYVVTQLPESRAGLRNGLAQQLMHEKMVEQQYGATQ